MTNDRKAETAGKTSEQAALVCAVASDVARTCLTFCASMSRAYMRRMEPQLLMCGCIFYSTHKNTNNVLDTSSIRPI